MKNNITLPLETFGKPIESIKHVVVYFNTNTSPAGFETPKEAQEYMNKEERFNDYEMAVWTIEDYLESVQNA